jgi:hypothetical protein
MAKFIVINTHNPSANLAIYEANSKEQLKEYLINHVAFDMRQEAESYFTDGSLVIAEVKQEITVS